jgi:hypothetical protein
MVVAEGEGHRGLGHVAGDDDVDVGPGEREGSGRSAVIWTRNAGGRLGPAA